MRAVLIGLPLGIALVSGVLAVMAPNPYPLVLLTLCGLACAQAASECCPREQHRQWARLRRKVRRRVRLRRLVGTIRNR